MSSNHTYDRLASFQFKYQHNSGQYPSCLHDGKSELHRGLHEHTVHKEEGLVVRGVKLEVALGMEKAEAMAVAVLHVTISMS